MYLLDHTVPYYSLRYGKSVTVPEGFESDGASGPAVDIYTAAWWVHDWLCDTRQRPEDERHTFDDGTHCSNEQASLILSDILKRDGRHIRAFTWRWATAIFGPRF